MKRSFGGRIVGIVAVAGFLLAACGGGEEAVVREGAATLEEVDGSGVSGEATLEWSSETQVLTVGIELDGLEEGVRYVSVISPGCETHSGLLYQTGVADGGADGTAAWTTEVADVESIDLDGGWAVRVVRPPTGEQACGEVAPS